MPEEKPPFEMPDPGVPCTPIDRIDDINSEQAARYVAESRPFIARVDWPLREWSPDYIRAKVGGAKIKETWKKTPEGPVKVRMTVKEYLDLIDDPVTHAKEHIIHNYPVMQLYSGWPPSPGTIEGFEPLLEDVKLPAFMKPELIGGMFVWARNTGWHDNKSHCETNACAGLNVQIRGKKRVWLFPPSEARMLGVTVPRQDLMTPAFLSSIQTVFQPSPEHPEFKDVQCYDGVLEPGDAIHVPTFWYHWFAHYNLYQLNFNVWFAVDTIPLSPVAAEWAYLNALSIALGDLPNLQEQFEQLPIETQELLTKISHILVGDPAATHWPSWIQMAWQREQPVIAGAKRLKPTPPPKKPVP